MTHAQRTWRPSRYSSREISVLSNGVFFEFGKADCPRGWSGVMAW
jgi:hypothetical protein